MGIDLERLYYGATAFLVFLVAFFAAQRLSDETWHLLLVSSVPMDERRLLPVVSPPPATTPPPAAITPVVAPNRPTPVPQPTLSSEQWEEIQRKERARLEDFELRSAKESVASSLAIVLVALPIWYFHWRRWRAMTQTVSVQLFRLYVYALMLITLIVAVLRGGSAIGKVVGLLLGVVDFSTRYASLSFAHELTDGVVGALIALLAWWYHRATVRAEGKE